MGLSMGARVSSLAASVAYGTRGLRSPSFDACNQRRSDRSFSFSREKIGK